MSRNNNHQQVTESGLSCPSVAENLIRTQQNAIVCSDCGGISAAKVQELLSTLEGTTHLFNQQNILPLVQSASNGNECKRATTSALHRKNNNRSGANNNKKSAARNNNRRASVSPRKKTVHNGKKSRRPNKHRAKTRPAQSTRNGKKKKSKSKPTNNRGKRRQNKNKK